MYKKKEINRIIVLRFRRVGDAVISSVLCSSLKKTFPKAGIDYVLNEDIAPLFKNHPGIDKIICFSKEEMSTFPAYIAKVKRIMKEGKYDMIVDTRSTVKTLWFSFFSMKTPFRIGKKKAYNPVFHNYRTPVEGVTDEVTKTLTLLKPLEKLFDIQYERNFKLYVTDKEKEYFRIRMTEGDIDFSRPVIICAVSARLKHKIWNPDKMKSVFWKIIEKYNAQLIFNYGGKDEKNFALLLHREMDNHRNIFTNIEANNLRELAAMFTLADFFVGNEGGPRHIAQSFNVPGFAIYPPGISKAAWLPNASERFQGIEPADISHQANNPGLSFSEKFDFITVEAVWERLDPMLEKFLVAGNRKKSLEGNL